MVFLKQVGGSQQTATLHFQPVFTWSACNISACFFSSSVFGGTMRCLLFMLAGDSCYVVLFYSHHSEVWNKLRMVYFILFSEHHFLLYRFFSLLFLNQDGFSTQMKLFSELWYTLTTCLCQSPQWTVAFAAGILWSLGARTGYLHCLSSLLSLSSSWPSTHFHQFRTKALQRYKYCFVL